MFLYEIAFKIIKMRNKKEKEKEPIVKDYKGMDKEGFSSCTKKGHFFQYCVYNKALSCKKKFIL